MKADLIAATLLVAALVLATLVAMGVFAGCSPPLTPCSPTDAEGAARFAECKARIDRECEFVISCFPEHGCVEAPDPECPVLRECERWAEQRCEEAP